MIDEETFLVEILAIPAVLDLMLSKPDISMVVNQTIRTLRAFDRPVTAENVIDYARSMGFPSTSALMLSAAVARSLGSGSRNDRL